MKSLLFTVAASLVSLISTSQVYVGFGGTTDKSVFVQAGYMYKSEIVDVIGGVNYKSPFKDPRVPSVLSFTAGIPFHLTRNEDREFGDFLFTPSVGLGNMKFTDLSKYEDYPHRITYVNENVFVYNLEIAKDFGLLQMGASFIGGINKDYSVGYVAFTLRGFFR